MKIPNIYPRKESHDVPVHVTDAGGVKLAHVSYDGQGEGDSDDGKHDAEQSSLGGHWGDVTVTWIRGFVILIKNQLGLQE